MSKLVNYSNFSIHSVLCYYFALETHERFKYTLKLSNVCTDIRSSLLKLPPRVSMINIYCQTA